MLVASPRALFAELRITDPRPVPPVRLEGWMTPYSLARPAFARGGVWRQAVQGAGAQPEGLHGRASRSWRRCALVALLETRQQGLNDRDRTADHAGGAVCTWCTGRDPHFMHACRGHRGTYGLKRGPNQQCLSGEPGHQGVGAELLGSGITGHPPHMDHDCRGDDFRLGGR